jgi:hypothetical protein
MAEIYLAIPVAYRDLPFLLYYLKESRERKFLPQWTKDRSWLAYEEYKQLMFCNWCRNHEVDRVFVKETNKFKLDADFFLPPVFRPPMPVS